ncbi:MAG: hypothetical protein ACI4SF_09755 [Oscillospiraceae bacterium]
MTDKEKLLTAVLQNSEMGSSAIRQIFPSVRDSSLRTELRHQLSEYEKQHNTVCRQMQVLHLKGKPVSPAAKAMTSIGIAVKTASDKSTGHIAEMLIQGTNMGIIEINKALNSAKEISGSLKDETKELLSKEQRYLDRLKAYL